MLYKIISFNNVNLISCLVISIFGVFLSSLLDLLFFIQVFDVKIEKKFRLVIIDGIVKSIGFYLLPIPYYRLVFIISTIVVFKIFSGKGWEKCIFAEVVNIISIILAELIMSKILFNVYSSTDSYVNGIYNKNYLKWLHWTILFVRVLAYVVIRLANYKILINDDLSKKNKKTICFISIIGIIIMYINYIQMILYIDDFQYFALLFDVFSLILYFILTVRYILRITSLEEQYHKIQNLETYNKTLSIMYDDIRGFRHDYSNFVQALNGYAVNNDMMGVSNMTKSVLSECQNIQKLSVLNPNIINNPALYSIITNKYYQAKEQNIEFNIDVKVDLNTINIPIYDLCRIMGILLDNALEAASKADNSKVINLIFENEEQRNRMLIIVENSFINKDVNLDKIFEKGYSSKIDSKNHGLGLWTVRKIIKNYNNVNLYTTKENLFKQQLEVYEK